VCRALAGFVILAAVPACVSAQDLRVWSPEERYLRVLQISGLADAGSLTVRPVLAYSGRPVSEGHPWATRDLFPAEDTDGLSVWMADARLRTWTNTTVPRGLNDGAVWAGKGLTGAFDATAYLRWGGLSVTVNPTLIYNQNAAFDLAPPTWTAPSEYAYPWRRIDWPQRFGSDSFTTFDLGQSRIAYDLSWARASFGNESLWWGPGIESAIIMSSNAPGFLHGSLSTSRPVDIGIGTLEGQWIWGGLDQSEYFDPTLAEEGRYLTAMVLTYSPSFLSGLSLGGTRVFQQFVPDGGLPFSEYFLVFQGLFKEGQVSDNQPDGTDARDQMVSLFGRWVFPESGLEAYVEWARTDHAGNLQDLVLEPEHSRGYTLGFQKVTSLSEDRALVLRGEMTQLESAATFQLRPRPTYYEHSVVTQGYTHKGQILGAWVGPGGNAQNLGFDWYDGWGRASFQFRRQVHDNDAFWVWAPENDRSFDDHDVSLDFGVDGLLFVGDFDLSGGIVFTHEINRYFYGPRVNNWNVQLGARWRPRQN
jgi:hypothetical protein